MCHYQRASPAPSTCIVGHQTSATKKFRKEGIRSALRTFLIFGSAFGPHWTQKVGIFPPIDEVYRHMLENHLILPHNNRRQYLIVDFHWSQYSLYYVMVGDSFSQFLFFQSLLTYRCDLTYKKSAFHI